MDIDGQEKKSLFYYLFKKNVFVLDNYVKRENIMNNRGLHKFFLCLVTTLILTFLISQESKVTTYSYEKGAIADSTIKAPFLIRVEDSKQVRVMKKNAREHALSVYDYDSKIPLDIQKNVDNAFGIIQRLYTNYNNKVDEVINSYAVNVATPPIEEPQPKPVVTPEGDKNTPVTLDKTLPKPDKELIKAKDVIVEEPVELITLKVGEREVSIPKDKKKMFEADIKAIQKPEEQIITMKKNFEEALKITLTDNEYKVLIDSKFTLQIRDNIKSIISKSMENFIVRDKGLLPDDQSKGIIIRKIETQKEDRIKDIGIVKDYKDVKNIIAIISKDMLSEIKSKKLVKLILNKSQELITPNLSLNKNETEKRKKKAEDAISPVFFEVKKGEVIVREGDPVEEQDILFLRKLSTTKLEYRYVKIFVGVFMMLLTLTLVGYRFASKNIRKFTIDFKDVLLMCVISIFGLLIAKGFIFISEAMSIRLPGTNVADYYYAIPFALGAMTIRIVLNSETALIYSLFSSLLYALLMDNSMIIFVYSFVGSLVAALGVTHCKQRTTMIKAGFMVGFINVLLILSFNTFNLKLDVFSESNVTQLVSGFANGIILSILVSGVIPIIEAVFGYTTDIKLLELANLDHPLLKKLPIHAPGTYQHSIIVGSMVEEAAKAINANPLLARVSSYYHDIGKIKKPLYFIENQREINNKHDKLSPNMSSLIIISHIREGVELATEHKLGKKIIDIIQQHHGTGLIKYFYKKAKDQEDENLQTVDEKDFKYPGPKPQTKEAGLVLLADVVEAAAKTIPEFTSARIQGVVQKMINKMFSEGQLDECELTLKDLNKIAKAFNHILNAIYHQRVDYPELAYKQSERKQKQNGDTVKKQSSKDTDKQGGDENEDKENLKRLGMSK